MNRTSQTDQTPRRAIVRSVAGLRFLARARPDVTRRGTRTTVRPNILKHLCFISDSIPELRSVEEDLRREETEAPAQEMFPEAAAKPEQVIEGGSAAAVRADEHALLAPYFKMQRVGVPEQSIRAKMARDGFDPAILDEPEAAVATELEHDNSNATTEDESFEFSE